MNKKSFLKAIAPDKTAAIETFIEDKQLKLKTENDFMELVKFYDGL